MPGRRGGDGAAGAIVLGEELTTTILAACTGGETRAMLAAQEDGVGRAGSELVGIDVTAAGHAVDVLRVMSVAAAARRLSLLLAFGQSFLSPHEDALSNAGSQFVK